MRMRLFRARRRGFAEQYMAADAECEQLLYWLESQSSENVQLGGGDRARLTHVQRTLDRFFLSGSESGD